MAKRISRYRRKGRPRLDHLPSDGLMRVIGALLSGERLTLTRDARLVLTSKGDPETGLVFHARHFDELERRGWLTLPAGTADAIVSPAGRMWFRIWWRQARPGERFHGVLVDGDAHKEKASGED